MQDFFIEAINSIRHISIFSILDILVVSYIFYKGYMLINETRAVQLLKGIVFIVALLPISYVLRLNMLYFILSKTLTIGVLTVVIIFQPEIRRALEHLGRTAFDETHNITDVKEREEIVEQIVPSSRRLS